MTKSHTYLVLETAGYTELFPFSQLKQYKLLINQESFKTGHTKPSTFSIAFAR